MERTESYKLLLNSLSSEQYALFDKYRTDLCLQRRYIFSKSLRGEVLTFEDNETLLDVIFGGVSK